MKKIIILFYVFYCIRAVAAQAADGDNAVIVVGRSKIEESFNGRGDFTESYAVNLLSNVDFLFFDDLGKESSMSGSLKEANEWRQRVLFKILDNRQTTFFNTNLSSNDIKTIYIGKLKLFKTGPYANI